MKVLNLGGDCAITFGHNTDSQIRVYASSAVLVKASPQFASLWQTSDIVIDLYFPQDNPVAVTVLMTILHYCYDSTTRPGPWQLLEFAAVASDCGCVNNVKSTVGLCPPETMVE
ncbi:hypothetical protein DOTSEDRAFT_26497 [Dothistroma septosporum NZE10]|uniref:BTB domain-containing protein n=1 Tax=Dothistroma septosporum (strain NZE10 / CBS 128990) TaxID=675120 RepID=N1PGR2_DOTSN|nr:hypothetical protein DOTSEDRAFT_26497 [Dothistroma septosporum NZE10]